MNNISAVRIEISKHFDFKQRVEGSENTSVSPNGRYTLSTVNYIQNKPDVNWTVTKVSILDNQTRNLMFEFYTDYHSFFHEWFLKGKQEFLVGAEVLCGGQTIINLSTKKMESFSPMNDEFIWTDFYPSPERNRLAVIGCFWACPYEVKIYDFSNPMTLPLPELKTVSLDEFELDKIEWKDNLHFQTFDYDGVPKIHSLDI